MKSKIDLNGNIIKLWNDENVLKETASSEGGREVNELRTTLLASSFELIQPQ